MADTGASIPPPPRPIELRDVDDGDWLLSMLFGVALVALGVWLLTNLFESVTVLGVLVGISLVVAGVAQGLALGGQGALGAVGWVAGGLLVVAGVVVVAWPDVTLWAIAVVAGAGLVVAGLLQALRALGDRDRPEWPAELAIGALGVAVGAVVLAWPGATLLVLAVLLGIQAVTTGIVAIATGWRLRGLRSGGGRRARGRRGSSSAARPPG